MPVTWEEGIEVTPAGGTGPGCTPAEGAVCKSAVGASGLGALMAVVGYCNNTQIDRLAGRYKIAGVFATHNMVDWVATSAAALVHWLLWGVRC